MKHVLCLSWSSKFLSLLLLMLSCLSANAQVNSGSNGSDGAFNPTGNVTINMADHPDGIYHYTSVNIPSGVTVTFTPNANNTAVVWLVQGNCVVAGTIDLSGQNQLQPNYQMGGNGGPGGWGGGNGGANPTPGLGPGGGIVGSLGQSFSIYYGGSFGKKAVRTPDGVDPTYGNLYLLPLLGGSGGGGVSNFGGLAGGGGGGALLIASSSSISITGSIRSVGGGVNNLAASGSGGAVRIVANTVTGQGSINVDGGPNGSWSMGGGAGRIRFDCFSNQFGGSTGSAVFTQGFQPIIIPASGQGVQLGIQSIGGVSVAGSPNGVLANPDVILPAQQTNPMNVVVNCSNLPMNTTITVTVRPANGADIVATGTNSSGTPTASTATIPVSMPRGGGIIFAKCVSGVAGSASISGDDYGKNIAQTGWTAHGERFAQTEITAGIGSIQQVAYITESGKRYTLPVQ
jgi:hypothetical protein